MVQVKIYDLDSKLSHGGIVLDNGDIVCACCGSLIERDKIYVDAEKFTGNETFEEIRDFYGNNEIEKCSTRILQVYKTWVDFSKEICD